MTEKTIRELKQLRGIILWLALIFPELLYASATYLLSEFTWLTRTQGMILAGLVFVILLLMGVVVNDALHPIHSEQH